VSLKRVQKGYGQRIIYDGLDFMVRRRERWCVMASTAPANPRC